VIESGRISTYELTKIKRQNPGDIVLNCHRIKAGFDIECSNTDDSDCIFVECESESEIARTIEDIVYDRLPTWQPLVERVGHEIDPLRDIQIITALRMRTSLSCKALNERCQARGSAPQRAGWSLRVGDKVIQTRNDYNLGLINGDIGFVQDFGRDEDGDYVLVEFGDDADARNVRIGLTGNCLDLAYAVTCHKYQGSEAPIVVIPIHRRLGPIITQRNWLYTAISRAQALCVLVGQRREIAAIVGRNKEARRYTGLARAMADRSGPGE